MSRMLTMLSLLLLCGGCEDFQQAMEDGGGRKPVTPPGIASTDDVEQVAGASDASTTKHPKPAEKRAHAGGGTGKGEGTGGGRGKRHGSQSTLHKTIVGRTTAKIVDAQKAKQNPRVVEVENKVSGSDPLTASLSVYVSISSKASTLGFQQAIKMYKALNDRNPTYDEFMKMAKENRVEFAELPPYQMYGYDAKSGGIVILEDKAEKIRLYKKNGIPIEAADKQYE